MFDQFPEKIELFGKFVQNGPPTFPSDIVKLGSEILYLFLAEKLSFVLFCFVCCNTLSDFSLLKDARL